MKSLSLAIGFAALMVSSVGCVDKHSYSAIQRAHVGPVVSTKPVVNEEITVIERPTDPVESLQVETIQIPGMDEAKVDLLFVVDNSLSMEDYQNILAKSFKDFITPFQKQGVDFHIGVISTDATSLDFDPSYWNEYHNQSPFKGWVDPAPGRLLSKSAERFLKPDSVDLVKKFQQNILLGTRGSSDEQALLSLNLMLKEALSSQNSFNAGFFRADSLKSFVIVSDENESVGGDKAAKIKERVANIVQNLKLLTTSASRGIRFDIVANLSAYHEKVSGYRSMNEAFQGKVHDLSKNFASALLSIGKDIVVQAKQEFVLQKKPVGDEWTVLFNGRELDRDPATGFEYLPLTNSIRISNKVLEASPNGGVLEIQYKIID
jgi:hypothetical protein